MEVIILCGGKGTRAYPFTEHFPKPMMPINGSPIIIHLMKSFAAQGFTDFVLAAGHKKEMLYDYFDGRFPQWNVRIVDTGADGDTGDRIARCEQYVGDRFMATYGDGLGNIDLSALVEAHEKSERMATLTTVPLRSQYGLVVFDEENKVERFEEKPVVNGFWINAGYMVIEKKAFQDWRGHNLEQEVLPHFASKGQLYTYEHTGFWKSMDTSKDQADLEKLAADGINPWTVFDTESAVDSASA